MVGRGYRGMWEACGLGRVEDMYKALNRLSKRDWKAPRSTIITVEQFRDHFLRDHQG